MSLFKEPSEEEFKVVQAFLEKECGIALSPNKKYLVQSRLERLLGEYQVSSYSDLIARTKNDGDSGLLERIVDNMTTNETFWFRDGYPFSIFRELVLPTIFQNNKSSRKIRIWCSASSTGQEAYSIAIMVKEFCNGNAGIPPGQFEILATDISSAALTIANKGFYDQIDMARGMPENYLPKYFVQKEKGWQIKDELKKMVRFQKFNLQGSFGLVGSFDVVFCRNVLIYFSREFKKTLLKKFAEVLRQEGYFFMGMSESVLGLSDAFGPVTHRGGVVYQKHK